MQFKEITGQSDVQKRLIYGVHNNRLSHALMFTGPEGNGKLQLALAFAQYVSCTNKQAADSCGECRSCKKYTKLIHPDLHFVVPVVRSDKNTKPVTDNYLKEWRQFILEKPYHQLSDWYIAMGAKKQQGGIFAQESSEIIRKLNLKTFESEYKIMVIWLPEKMNASSANKLLKMIEEPPPKTLFLMVSEAPDQIIKTILSRTQMITVPRIDKDSMREFVKEQFDVEDALVNNIVHLSGGNLVKAYEAVVSTEENKTNFEWFSNWMRLCYSAKVLDLLEWVDSVAATGREKQKSFLEYALRIVRENFALNISPEQSIAYLANDEAGFSNKFSVFIHQNNIEGIAAELNLAHYHIERNALNKLVLFDLSLKISRLLHIKAA